MSDDSQAYLGGRTILYADCPRRRTTALTSHPINIVKAYEALEPDTSVPPVLEKSRKDEDRRGQEALRPAQLTLFTPGSTAPPARQRRAAISAELKAEVKNAQVETFRSELTSMEAGRKIHFWRYIWRYPAD